MAVFEFICVFIGGPAKFIVALAFLGVFDHRRRAGAKV
jgi:hypothetical protein